MMEAKLFDGDVPHVSTFEFHKDRERAPHWDQPTHRERLMTARNMVISVARGRYPESTFAVDLGCGDGGLVAALIGTGVQNIRGYDFQPSNVFGWKERGVDDYCAPLDFVSSWEFVPRADVYVITECLEHLADPHDMLINIRSRDAMLIASSPWTETYESHDECHAWAWDMEGYSTLVRNAKFSVMEHTQVGMFQVICARPA